MEELKIRGVAYQLAATGTTIRELRLFGTIGIDLARLPSEFASLLITPQFQTERVLARRLDDLGVSIVHDAEVVNLTQDADGVEVRTGCTVRCAPRLGCRSRAVRSSSRSCWRTYG